jgi:hypothetical protein
VLWQKPRRGAARGPGPHAERGPGRRRGGDGVGRRRSRGRVGRSRDVACGGSALLCCGAQARRRGGGAYASLARSAFGLAGLAPRRARGGGTGSEPVRGLGRAAGPFGAAAAAAAGSSGGAVPWGRGVGGLATRAASMQAALAARACAVGSLGTVQMATRPSGERRRRRGRRRWGAPRAARAGAANMQPRRTRHAARPRPCQAVDLSAQGPGGLPGGRAGLPARARWASAGPCPWAAAVKAWGPWVLRGAARGGAAVGCGASAAPAAAALTGSRGPAPAVVGADGQCHGKGWARAGAGMRQRHRGFKRRFKRGGGRHRGEG